MLRIVLRNLLHTFRRFPLPTTINMAGLVVALTAFIVITSHVEFETSYDRSYPTSGRIFRVDCPGNDETFRSILPNAFARDVINSSAHIEAGTTLMPYMGELPVRIQESDGEVHTYELRYDLVEPPFIKVFGVEILSGDPKALEKPSTVIIPESMAETLFGSDAVGKTMHTDESWFFPEGGEMTVGAVYKDFPENSNLRNSIYFAMDENVTPYTYGGANHICYLLLDDRASAPLVEEEFNSHFDFSLSWMSPIELVPVEDIYFMGQEKDGRTFQSGSRSATLLITAIAILVLLSGAINFANFFTSLVPVRIRSINTQKVVGASVSSLRTILTLETVTLAVGACIIAIGLAAWISPRLAAADIVSGTFTLHHTGIVATTLLTSLIAGILAGLYPSWYATSFPPAMVLKGDFGLSHGGRIFRSVMSGIQYVVAFVTLIFMTFLLLQNRLVRNTDLGFEKDHIAVTKVPASIYGKMDMLSSAISKYPSIAGVTSASELIGGQSSYSTSTFDYNEKETSCFVIGVYKDFLKVMGIDLVDGRDFNEHDTEHSWIVTRYFMDQFGMHAGETVGGSIHIVGICDNLKINSARDAAMPVVLTTYDFGMPYLYFRLNAGSNAHTAVSEIRALLHEADPTWTADVQFYDSLLDNLYRGELRTSRMVVIFSVIAALLAICGVIGMVLFDTEYKKKETAVRKIFGASVSSILKRANASYGTVVLVCFVLSCPVAAVLTSRWLENFVERVQIHPWVFALALVVVLAVTAGIVTAVFYRRATSNPREGLN